MIVKNFIVTILVFNAIAINAQNMTKAPWTDYVGSHYDTRAWAGWVRDYTMQTATRSYMNDTTIGSGPLDTAIISSFVNDLFNEMSTLPERYCATVQTSSLGRGIEGVYQYMSRLEADSGATWRELCKQQAIKLAQLPNGKNRIFWQVGNEISSPSYSEKLNLWKGNPVPCSGNGCDYDTEIIPVYVENYFAPAVQGINEASVQVYGSRDSINIILGSLTNAGGAKAYDWLETLLNYTIEGTYASDLTGKKVYELVDIISIHYMMGNSGSAAWEGLIQRYRDTWIGVGKIKGIWSTEEVGIRAAESGLGAVRGAAATSRYLEWAITNDYSPYQCRTNYWAHWAGPAGSTVNDLNQEVFEFLGDSHLSLVHPEQVIYDNPDVESHAFLSSDSTKGVIYTFLMSSSQQGSISDFEISGPAIGNIMRTESHYFSPLGHQEIESTMSNINETFEIHLNTSCELDSGKAVIVTFVHTQPFSTTTGKQSNIATNSFVSIYPNPAHDILHVDINDCNGDIEIRIYNLFGAFVKLFKNQAELKIADLREGIYYLDIKTDHKIINSKFVKK